VPDEVKNLYRRCLQMLMRPERSAAAEAATAIDGFIHSRQWRDRTTELEASLIPQTSAGSIIRRDRAQEARKPGSTCCRRARTRSTTGTKRCDNIDKQYANLARLADMNRDKEFQMFWANCEVIKPSIYAKPPHPGGGAEVQGPPAGLPGSLRVPSAAPRSRSTSPHRRLMKLVRDDLALIDRGVAWCRYESGKRAATTTTRRSASTSRTAATSCTRSRATGAR
jgi:hypothetical protein